MGAEAGGWRNRAGAALAVALAGYAYWEGWRGLPQRRTARAAPSNMEAPGEAEGAVGPGGRREGLRYGLGTRPHPGAEGTVGSGSVFPEPGGPAGPCVPGSHGAGPRVPRPGGAVGPGPVFPVLWEPWWQALCHQVWGNCGAPAVGEPWGQAPHPQALGEPWGPGPGEPWGHSAPWQALQGLGASGWLSSRSSCCIGAASHPPPASRSRGAADLGWGGRGTQGCHPPQEET